MIFFKMIRPTIKQNIPIENAFAAHIAGKYALGRTNSFKDLFLIFKQNSNYEHEDFNIEEFIFNLNFQLNNLLEERENVFRNRFIQQYYLRILKDNHYLSNVLGLLKHNENINSTFYKNHSTNLNSIYKLNYNTFKINEKNFIKKWNNENNYSSLLENYNKNISNDEHEKKIINRVNVENLNKKVISEDIKNEYYSYINSNSNYLNYFGNRDKNNTNIFIDKNNYKYIEDTGEKVLLQTKVKESVSDIQKSLYDKKEFVENILYNLKIAKSYFVKNALSMSENEIIYNEFSKYEVIKILKLINNYESINEKLTLHNSLKVNKAEKLIINNSETLETGIATTNTNINEIIKSSTALNINSEAYYELFSNNSLIKYHINKNENINESNIDIEISKYYETLKNIEKNAYLNHYNYIDRSRNNLSLRNNNYEASDKNFYLEYQNNTHVTEGNLDLSSENKNHYELIKLINNNIKQIIYNEANTNLASTSIENKNYYRTLSNNIYSKMNNYAGKNYYKIINKFLFKKISLNNLNKLEEIEKKNNFLSVNNQEIIEHIQKKRISNEVFAANIIYNLVKNIKNDLRIKSHKAFETSYTDINKEYWSEEIKSFYEVFKNYEDISFQNLLTRNFANNKSFQEILKYLEVNNKSVKLTNKNIDVLNENKAELINVSNKDFRKDFYENNYLEYLNIANGSTSNEKRTDIIIQKYYESFKTKQNNTYFNFKRENLTKTDFGIEEKRYYEVFSNKEYANYYDRSRRSNTINSFSIINKGFYDSFKFINSRISRNYYKEVIKNVSIINQEISKYYKTLIDNIYTEINNSLFKNNNEINKNDNFQYNPITAITATLKSENYYSIITNRNKAKNYIRYRVTRNEKFAENIVYGLVKHIENNFSINEESRFEETYGIPIIYENNELKYENQLQKEISELYSVQNNSLNSKLLNKFKKYKNYTLNSLQIKNKYESIHSQYLQKGNKDFYRLLQSYGNNISNININNFIGNSEDRNIYLSKAESSDVQIFNINKNNDEINKAENNVSLNGHTYYEFKNYKKFLEKNINLIKNIRENKADININKIYNQLSTIKSNIYNRDIQNLKHNEQLINLENNINKTDLINRNHVEAKDSNIYELKNTVIDFRNILNKYLINEEKSYHKLLQNYNNITSKVNFYDNQKLYSNLNKSISSSNYENINITETNNKAIKNIIENRYESFSNNITRLFMKNDVPSLLGNKNEKNSNETSSEMLLKPINETHLEKIKNKKSTTSIQETDETENTLILKHHINKVKTEEDERQIKTDNNEIKKREEKVVIDKQENKISKAEMDSIIQKVYREIEKKITFERQRRGG